MHQLFKNLLINEILIVETAKQAKAWREYLHSNPELSGQEENTALFINDVLKNINISEIINYSNKSISALIGNKESKTVIGIRAEMDALPINQVGSLNYKSKKKGVMHACGHDFHMSLLLALAKILKPYEQELDFCVKLIFQASEETLPGGAKQLIDEGVLENPKVDYMLAAHVLPELEAGKFGFKPEQYLASGDEIYITLVGKGGHAAMPEKINDPVVSAAQLIITLQQIVSRKASPLVPTVLSFGKFIANGRTNVIPDKVEIEGTLRTFCETQRFKLHDYINDTCNGISLANNILCKLNIVNGYPTLINNPELTSQISNSFSSTFNQYDVIKLPIRMTTDDFAYYSYKVPSCYFRIGVGYNSSLVKELHTPHFDINPEAYYFGVKGWLCALMSFCK